MTKYQKFTDYLVGKLHNPQEAKAFLDASIIEYEEDGNTEAFMLALRYIAEAQGGISKLSQKTHLNKQNLYKILSGKTTPKFDTTLAIMKGLGFRFVVRPTAII